MNHESIRIKLINLVTDIDRKNSTKKGYSMYALSHYFKAVDAIMHHLKYGEDLRTCIVAFFLGSMGNKILKAFSLDKLTKDEEYGIKKNLEYPE